MQLMLEKALLFLFWQSLWQGYCDRPASFGKMSAVYSKPLSSPPPPVPKLLYWALAVRRDDSQNATFLQLKLWGVSKPFFELEQKEGPLQDLSSGEIRSVKCSSAGLCLDAVTFLLCLLSPKCCVHIELNQNCSLQ